MNCIVHGVPKSQTRLSHFHFTVNNLSIMLAPDLSPLRIIFHFVWVYFSMTIKSDHNRCITRNSCCACKRLTTDSMLIVCVCVCVCVLSTLKFCDYVIKSLSGFNLLLLNLAFSLDNLTDICYLTWSQWINRISFLTFCYHL